MMDDQENKDVGKPSADPRGYYDPEYGYIGHQSRAAWEAAAAELDAAVAAADEEYEEWLRSHPHDDTIPRDMRLNLAGRIENAAYPPNHEAYGYIHSGYATDKESAFFAYFMVHGYDLEFRYGGHWWFIRWNGYDKKAFIRQDARMESEGTLAYEALPRELLENFRIDGKRLVDIINDVEDVEPL